MAPMSVALHFTSKSTGNDTPISKFDKPKRIIWESADKFKNLLVQFSNLYQAKQILYIHEQSRL